jgi:hypothetical protein
MKTRGLVWIAAVLAAGSVWAQSDDGYRTFTDTKGRSICGRVVDYDPAKSKFLVERDGRYRTWLSAAALSQDGQTYLKDWLRSYKVLFEKALAVTVEPQKGLLQNAGTGRFDVQKTQEYSSIVSVSKRTDAAIEDFRIEYRYVVADVNLSPHAVVTEISMDAEEADSDVPRQYGGEFEFGSITNGQTLTFNTGALTLTNEYIRRTEADLFGSSYHETLVRQTQVLGIWLKVYGAGSNGVPIVRDICIPEDLYEKVTWSKSVPSLPAPTLQAEPEPAQPAPEEDTGAKVVRAARR